MDIMKNLQEPFDPQDIEWRVGSTNGDKSKGIALAYVTNRAIMNRLDELFGPFGWRNEFKEWKGNSQLCGISIKFNDEWITKWDGADDSATEAIKGGLSDAMKRAGYQWGIGRYLYNLENQWVPIKPQGRSFVLASKPKLPQWALPKGYVYGSVKTVEPLQPQIDTTSQESTNEDLAAIESASQETYGAAPPEQPQSNNPVSKASMARVYKLREQLHMEWSDLNNFAGTVLGREIKFLKSNVKTEEEWKQIEEALKVAV